MRKDEEAHLWEVRQGVASRRESMASISSHPASVRKPGRLACSESRACGCGASLEFGDIAPVSQPLLQTQGCRLQAQVAVAQIRYRGVRRPRRHRAES